MQEKEEVFERRTTADLVFDQLYEDIASLKVLPGSKLSEAEIARRFGVSRQPVRDAFNRLGNLDLLLIRPQRATEVRGFSMDRVQHARFVRLAVELEVVHRASAIWDDTRASILDASLDQQQQVIDAGHPEKFHDLDYAFHKKICELGGYPLAFETIQECKQKIDRLCLLSLGRASEAALLLEDHRALAKALRSNSAEQATAMVRQHLGRLDDTITDIHTKHSSYFE